MGDLHSDEQSADGRFHSQPFTTTHAISSVILRPEYDIVTNAVYSTILSA